MVGGAKARLEPGSHGRGGIFEHGPFPIREALHSLAVVLEADMQNELDVFGVDAGRAQIGLTLDLGQTAGKALLEGGQALGRARFCSLEDLRNRNSTGGYCSSSSTRVTGFSMNAASSSGVAFRFGASGVLSKARVTSATR